MSCDYDGFGGKPKDWHHKKIIFGLDGPQIIASLLITSVTYMTTDKIFQSSKASTGSFIVALFIVVIITILTVAFVNRTQCILTEIGERIDQKI